MGSRKARAKKKGMSLRFVFLLAIFLVLLNLYIGTNFGHLTGQVTSDAALAQVTITQKALVASDSAVENQKNIVLLRFEAQASQADALLTKIMFSAKRGSLLNATNYALWVDSDGDRTVDFVLQRGISAQGDLVRFDQWGTTGAGYLLPAGEQCESDNNCGSGETCTQCRCTATSARLRSQVLPVAVPTPQGGCTDSDGGLNAGAKGTTTNVYNGKTYVGNWTDICQKDWQASTPANQAQNLLEGYCVGTIGRVMMPPYTLPCALGCDAGRCIELGLRSAQVLRSTGSLVYDKNFAGCVQLRDEKSRTVPTQVSLCGSGKSVTVRATLAALPLPEGKRVKLCKDQGSLCSNLLYVTRISACGDGIVQKPEVCDDGNTINEDGCSNACQLPQCGDGIKQVNEECDSGVPCDGGRVCEIGTCLCKASSGGSCGNGILDPGEECDAGIPCSGSGSKVCAVEHCTCTFVTCSPPPVCGDGIVEGAEQCEPGVPCVGTHAGAICDTTTCRCSAAAPVCGDGTKDAGEECDSPDNPCHAGQSCDAFCRCQTDIENCGNGTIDPGAIVVFEVRADIAASLTDNALQLQFKTEVPGFVEAEDAHTGTTLDDAHLTVTTLDATSWVLKNQGDLFVTADATPTPARQLLGGALGDAILRLRLHAEGEDIDVTGLQFTSSGGLAQSVDSLELWQEGAHQPFAVTSGCPGSSSTATLFCASMDTRQLVAPKGDDVKILIRPRMKSDVNGAVSGERIALWLDGTPIANDATREGAVRARGAISDNTLSANNGNGTADGEIFIGTGTPVANKNIVGNVHMAVLAKLASIVNGGVATGTMPLGSDRDIGSFTFAALTNANTKNGLNSVVLSGIVLTVSATNVLLDASSFKLYNKASATQSVRCTATTLSGARMTGTASGNFLVDCRTLVTGPVNTVIDQGGTATFALMGTITDANTEIASGGKSLLQISLHSFADITLRSSGPSPERSHVQWRDTDGGGATTLLWFESPDTVVNSTVFQG